MSKESWEEFNRYENLFNKINRIQKNMLKNKAQLPNPVTKEWIQNVEENNIYIMKKDLEIDSFYYGHCRNAILAKWNGKKFTYIRSKFGNEFPEDINHFEDDDGFDLFLPFFKLNEKHEKIPYLKELIDKLNK